MPVRSAEAVWEGNLREGHGTMKLASGAFEGRYTWSSRFEDAPGTNPEELVGAAHAGCFSMALSSGLTRAGHPPTSIHTTARVHFDKVGDGFKIVRVALETEASVPGIDQQAFQAAAESAKQTCPISQALASVEITLQAHLLA